jgi:hypothetical protein
MRKHAIRNGIADGVRVGNFTCVRRQSGDGGDMAAQVRSALARVFAALAAQVE